MVDIGLEKKREIAEGLRKRLEKDFGTGIVKSAGSNIGIDIESISTGSIGLDYATGVGGFPRGRITEIYGHESSGKTTLALSTVAEAQNADDSSLCAIIDAENALDPVWMERIGVDMDRLDVSQPDTGEDALEILQKMVETGIYDVIVVDSVAALVPRAEVEGEMGDSHVGLQARLMSQALRKLSGIIKKTDTCVIFINQLRENISVSSFGGSKYTTSGGRALKYYASVRIDVRGISTQKSKGESVGREVKASIKKNKVGPPFREAQYTIFFDSGISWAAELLLIGLELNFIKRAGAYYKTHDGDVIGQGLENARIALQSEEWQDFAFELENNIRDELNLPKIRKPRPPIRPFRINSITGRKEILDADGNVIEDQDADVDDNDDDSDDEE